MASRTTSCTTPGSVMLELPGPVAVVCHDAGAANLILAWLEAGHWPRARLLAAGPAAIIAGRMDLSVQSCTRLEDAVAGAGSVLTGTGWASKLEHEARAAARAWGIHSVAVLDHWVNYQARLERGGNTVLPDQLWVTDAYALAEAHRCFPGMEVRMQPNLYLEKTLRLVGTPGASPDVLYLAEPARSDWGRGLPGELQALDYFVEHMGRLGLREGARLRLRQHPQEPAGKYDAWIAAHHPLAVLDHHEDLSSAMAPVAWVAGCETAALAIALASGRQAICTLPPWAPPCRLPHQDLIHLKLLVRGTP